MFVGVHKRNFFVPLMFEYKADKEKKPVNNNKTSILFLQNFHFYKINTLPISVHQLEKQTAECIPL